MNPKASPCGSWSSPISARMVAAGAVGLEQVAIDRGDIYWTESRPAEAGRTVIMKQGPAGQNIEMLPPGFSAGTRVHEYGGGSFTVFEGVIYFSNLADQAIYRIEPGYRPTVVAAGGRLRYADLTVDGSHGRMICVREDHSAQGKEPVNTLASIHVRDGRAGEEPLVSGHDFYSTPRISTDGSHLAWLAWNHPHMPWDASELWVGSLRNDGSLAEAERVAGGPDESIYQPEWSPDGRLYFVSDRSGFWNLYRLNQGRIEPVCQMEAEFGRPQWVLGTSTYGFCSADLIVCCFVQKGRWHIGLIDLSSGRIEKIGSPFTDIRDLKAAQGVAVFIGGGPAEPQSVVSLDASSKRFQVLRRSSAPRMDQGYVSCAKEVEFPTQHGSKAYGFFYEPRNKDHIPQAKELPPLLVRCHGGPTSAASTSPDPETQYWTSRGFAVLDVNYGGSTGYGRAYRRRLEGRWGIVDVEDCISGAQFLIDQGLVDEGRVAIRGRSAGGYTALCAIAFNGLFKAAACYYGISDLEALAKETHKFESHYLDRLIGPYPDQQDLYRKRSPIYASDRIDCPVIIFQGLEDKVVPAEQAERMVDGLRARGLPVAYVIFDNEGHGFRRAENIERALECELSFYARIFGFEPAGPISSPVIENM